MAAATAADTGNVKTQVQMIFPATPQRTTVSRLVAPTPTIAPAIVWVVLTGIPHTSRHDGASALGSRQPWRWRLPHHENR